MISEPVERALQFHRDDYSLVEGHPFRHFYCPLLMRDEPVELCMGHVVPAALPGCSRARVVQRSDVDNWYGRVFEAEMVLTIEAMDNGLTKILSNPDLMRRHKPKMFVREQECEYFPSTDQRGRHRELPPGFSAVRFEQEGGGDLVRLMVKAPKQMLLETTGVEGGQIVAERDGRLVAFVGLIKSAYLTLFRLLGYRWALSAAGLEIGHSLLGNFFLDNCSVSSAVARENARDAFRFYLHAVRPNLDFSEERPRGTVEDGMVGVCHDTLGRPYAMMVHIRLGRSVHGVLMPAYAEPETASRYWGLLNGEEQSFTMQEYTFDKRLRQWRREPWEVKVIWPREGAAFID